MATSTFFVQICPTCGRRVEVRVEYLGRRVACDHCGGRFIAEDPNGVVSGSLAISGMDLLSRADRLLQVVAARQARTG
ncbi:MAG: hypothetical protein WD875_14020 [Pirellulales bacterium]